MGESASRPPPGRVLYVFARTMRGQGLGLVAQHQVLALAEQGWQVDLIARGGVESPRVHTPAWPRLPAQAISWLRLDRNAKQDLRRRLFGALGARALRSGRYDAVITWQGLGWKILPEARRLGCAGLLNCGNFPIVSGPEDPNPKRAVWPGIESGLLRSEWNAPDVQLLVTSEHARRRFEQAGCAAQRLHAIGRGMDPERFFPAPAPREGPFRVLFCGRLTRRKRIFRLLELWRDAQLPDAELWLCGPVPERHRKRIESLATPSVKILGYRPDVAEVMRQCDAQILLSSNEGQAKALLEGAACGLVTIATREAGFPFHLGDFGYEIPASDLSQARRALERLASEPDARRILAERSAKLAREHLTWAAFHGRFLAGFQTALAEHAAARPDSRSGLG